MFNCFSISFKLNNIQTISVNSLVVFPYSVTIPSYNRIQPANIVAVALDSTRRRCHIIATALHSDLTARYEIAIVACLVPVASHHVATSHHGVPGAGHLIAKALDPVAIVGFGVAVEIGRTGAGGSTGEGRTDGQGLQGLYKYTPIKKKIQFPSYIRKFTVKQLQSHI